MTYKLLTYTRLLDILDKILKWELSQFTIKINPVISYIYLTTGSCSDMNEKSIFYSC